MQALAAVLGGTQSLHTNSYDETYALPTEEAATLALRTQQVLAEESGVAQVADPLGGSYFIEALTDRMEAEAMAYIDRIDAMGGIVKAVEEGYPQREIARAAYDFQRQVDSGERGIVGVNKYRSGAEAAIPTLKIDNSPEQQQIDRVQAARTHRDPARAERCLAAVRAACKDDRSNLMPPILDAVKAHVTLGEICDIFRDEFGVHTDPAYL
jgi:methylmalonyl-CoA mutase N-terminal domain/subunit